MLCLPNSHVKIVLNKTSETCTTHVATYGPLNIIWSPRVLCTLRYPWWPPWRGNHHLQAQGVRNEANELVFSPWNFQWLVQLNFPFWGQQKAYFQRLFAVSFREFFFHVWNLTPWQKSTFFCNTFPVPSLGAFWFINFKPCRIFLVSFLDVLFGRQWNKTGLKLVQCQITMEKYWNQQITMLK